MDKNILEISQIKPMVHKVLAHSYSLYLVALLSGAFLNIFFPIKLLDVSFLSYVSLVILLLSTWLIYWAQKSSRNFNNNGILTKETFMNGPYRYTRNPTNLGLFFSMISFGFIADSTFIILSSLVAFLFSSLIFVKKEEAILINKYGEPYKEYKKAVKY